MPKGKIQVPGTRKSVAVRRKSKIGGRKNAVSAHMVSTGELLKKLENNTRKRDTNNILHALRARGLAADSLLASGGQVL